MNALDDYIERAGSGAVLMVSQAAMDDIRYNTPSESWLHDGIAAAARQGGDVQQAPGEAPQSGGDSRIAQHGSGG
jgi:hypothetical protein